MSTATPETVGQDELEHVLRKTLEASSSPLSPNQVLNQLTGPFRRPQKDLEDTLEAMSERGQIFRFGKYRGTQRYWDRQPDEYARNVMLEKLGKRPLTRSELLRSVEKPLQVLSKNRREEILRELVRSGAVKELPPFIGARTKRLSPHPVDPHDYVAQALQKICEHLSKNGVSKEQVHAAAREILGSTTSTAMPAESERRNIPPSHQTVRDSGLRPEPPADVKDVVLARMMEIEVGALIPFTKFRQGLDFQDRREVDEAIWDLVRNEMVAVHKHHHPIAMSEIEREASLRDNEGNLYHAISRRYR